MFSKSEIELINEAFVGRENITIDDFLYKDEVELIKKYGTFTYGNLKNKIISNLSPRLVRHNVTIQNLWYEFDLTQYLLNISGKIRYSDVTDVQIGFSFIGRNSKTNDKTYFFAAKAYSNFSRRISCKEDMKKIANEMSQLKDSDHLMNTFLISEENNRFRSSGWVPEALVCCYIYITK